MGAPYNVGMTKNELVKAVAAMTGYSQSSCGKVIDAFLTSVQASLERGDDVRLYGFGNLVMSPRPARTVKLYGKEEKEVPDHWYPVFEPGGRLKDAGRELIQHKKFPEAKPKKKSHRKG